VSDNTSTELQDLIDRLHRGDEIARRALIERVHDRLLRIATTLFDPDRSGPHGRRQLESAVSDIWLRSVGTLGTQKGETVDGFVGSACAMVRQVLLEIAQGQRRLEPERKGGDCAMDQTQTYAGSDPALTEHEAGNLAVLTEFHQQVETLPDDLRTVFELRYYGGFSQPEIAQMLELDPKQVSRRWLAATGRLAQWLKGLNQSS